MRRMLIWILVFLFILLSGPLWVLLTQQPGYTGSWRDAPHDSTGQAPPAEEFKEAVVQVYTARAFSWRRAFSVHTWIAAKPKNGTYRRYEAIGWRKFQDLPPMAVHSDYAPDALWFGEYPVLLKEIGGERAEVIIRKLDAAVEFYPYKNDYKVFPGPNSNTFIAYLARRVPELGLDLPANAVGKDYLEPGKYRDLAPSATGEQFSFHGVFGYLWAEEEGFEVNILGMNFGYDFDNRRIRYPGIGYLP